jgi:hypothetical protein
VLRGSTLGSVSIVDVIGRASGSRPPALIHRTTAEDAIAIAEREIDKGRFPMIPPMLQAPIGLPKGHRQGPWGVRRPLGRLHGLPGPSSSITGEPQRIRRKSRFFSEAAVVQSGLLSLSLLSACSYLTKQVK